MSLVVGIRIYLRSNDTDLLRKVIAVIEAVSECTASYCNQSIEKNVKILETKDRKRLWPCFGVVGATYAIVNTFAFGHQGT